MFLIFISGINEVYSQTGITDAGVQMHETTAGMECRFVIVVEDTSNVHQLEVKLGSSAGDYSLVNAVFDFDVTGGLPAGYSYQRNGNAITLVTGTLTEQSTWFGSVQIKNNSGQWSDAYDFIAN
ncbi:MAG: hypothetical protein JNL47_00970 [Bacteroidia bacterium]|nr:hypothetical protein [Bacteroidia bacterium]